jgi:hypothetical protein
VSKVFEICHQNLNSVRFLVNSNLTARVTTATNAAKGHVAVEHHFSEHQCYVCANSDQAGELTAERLTNPIKQLHDECRMCIALHALIHLIAINRQESFE